MSGYIALGKYSNEFEDALHYLCNSGWATGEFGGVEAPTGLVWKISNTWDDVKPENGEFNSLMEEWFAQNSEFADSEEFRRNLVGDFIIREDNNGSISMQSFPTQEDMLDTYRGLRDDFEQWDSEEDEEYTGTQEGRTYGDLYF